MIAGVANGYSRVSVFRCQNQAAAMCEQPMIELPSLTLPTTDFLGDTNDGLELAEQAISHGRAVWLYLPVRQDG
jgi:hypothetical protein